MSKLFESVIFVHSTYGPRTNILPAVHTQVKKKWSKNFGVWGIAPMKQRKHPQKRPKQTFYQNHNPPVKNKNILGTKLQTCY